MAKERERKTERKVKAATAEHVKRADPDTAPVPPKRTRKSKRTKRATAAAGTTRNIAGIAARRMGADRALSRTATLIDVSADDALESLYRLAVLDYLFLTTKCRELERFYELMAAARHKSLAPAVREATDPALVLTESERVHLAEQIRQFATGKNRALQSALNVQKQYAEQHLAEQPEHVQFEFEDPEPEAPPEPEHASVH